MEDNGERRVKMEDKRSKWRIMEDKIKNVLFFYCFCIFIPHRVKISTLPPLCFMFYYTMRFICNPKKIKITKKYSSPLLGKAPKDPKARPTVTYLCSQPQCTPENVHFSYSWHRAPLAQRLWSDFPQVIEPPRMCFYVNCQNPTST